MIESYKAGYKEGIDNGYALRDTLKAVKDAADRMLAMAKSPESASDALLLQDLRPWLMKLSSMAETAQLLMNLSHMDRPSMERDFVINKIHDTLTAFKGRILPLSCTPWSPATGI